MIIFLFFAVTIAVFISMTIFINIYWLIPVYLLFGIVSGYVFVALTALLTYPLVVFTKPHNKLKHFYLRQMVDFVRIFVLRVHVSEFIGQENLPKDSNFVAYANHRSGIDPFVIISKFKTPIAFPAKNNLFKFGISNVWLKRYGVLSIDRENDREALKEIIRGIKMIEDGLSMMVFPEGTRKSQKFHTLDTFKPGAFRLATKPKVPVIPVGIIGAQDFRKNAVIRKTSIKIVVGKPIYYEEYKDWSSVELSEIVAKKIMVLLKENEEL